MAASVLTGKTAVFCRAFNRVSSLKTLVPAPPGCGPCGLLTQTAAYNAKPLKLNLHEPYIPDKSSERTPAWQRTAKYDRKLYGRHGSASRVDPATLWPTHEQLEQMMEEEKEWHRPLEVMLQNIHARQQEDAAKRLEKEKLIAANMAKMPKMVADWRRERREAKLKVKEDKVRRERLLAEARERFGYAVDPRSPKFLDMVAEIEKEEKKKMKLLKRRQRAEQAGVPGVAASSS